MKSKFLSFLIVILLLFSTNCTQDNQSLNSESSNNLTICGDLNQLESYGDFVYNHIKYDLAVKSPDGIIPENYRSQFITEFNSLNSLYSDLSLEEVINQSTTLNGTIYGNFLLSLNTTIDNVLMSNPSYENMRNAISNLEALQSQNNNISCKDRVLIKLTCSMYKKVIIYLEENFPQATNNISNNLTEGDCNFFKRIGCIFKPIGKNLVITQDIAAEMWDSGGGFVEFFVELAVIIAIVIFAIVVGLIQGIFLAFNGEKCCPKEWDCRAPLGISIDFQGCDQPVNCRPWGFGADIVGFQWVNVNGTPQNATTLVSNPDLQIAQLNLNLPVTTTITSGCGNGTTNSTIFNLNFNELSKKILNVILTGPISTSSEQEEPLTYSLIGFDPDIYEIVGWGAWNGTVISNTNRSCQILWDNTKNKGEALVTIKNKCPGGEIKTFVVKVTIGGGPL